MESYFSELLGKKVKVLFLDNGKTKVVNGILNQVFETYIIVDQVAIGLGSNFISCIPQEGKHE
jgi:hypothetical protein